MFRVQAAVESLGDWPSRKRRHGHGFARAVVLVKPEGVPENLVRVGDSEESSDTWIHRCEGLDNDIAYFNCVLLRSPTLIKHREIASLPVGNGAFVAAVARTPAREEWAQIHAASHRLASGLFHCTAGDLLSAPVAARSGVAVRGSINGQLGGGAGGVGTVGSRASTDPVAVGQIGGAWTAVLLALGPAAVEFDEHLRAAAGAITSTIIKSASPCQDYFTEDDIPGGVSTSLNNLVRPA